MDTPGDQRVALDLPFKLIQAVRLAHAVMESGMRICVPAEEAEKFAYLRGTFDLTFEAGTEGAPVLRGVELAHDLPRTRIGAVERPLIFPHGIVTRCRETWANHRDVGTSFCGLITDERRALLERWAGAHLDPVPKGQDDRMHLTHRAELGTATTLEIWSSRRGRRFPIKAWDEDYYRLLARSRFVLCPNGDFVWTYRFFEAVLCGAIPVVEQHAPAYEGFSYRTMADPASDADYDPEAAARNHALAIEKLTVPREQLLGALLDEIARAVP